MKFLESRVFPNIYITYRDSPGLISPHDWSAASIIAQYLKHGYKKCVKRKGFMFAPFQIRRKISSPIAKMSLFSLKGFARKVNLQF